MIKRTMAPIILMVMISLNACRPTYSPLLSLLPTAGAECDEPQAGDDLISGFTAETTHPLNQKNHGCLVVTADEGFPVIAGSQSLRFEVRPGDCSGNDGFDDCANDRSRHEIQEREGTFSGEATTYEANLFVPSQPKFKPRGNNLMFLSQLTISDGDYFGTLVFLEVNDHQNLLLRTHQGFSWDIDQQILVATDIFDRWINFRYEVIPSPNSGGSLRVYVDDQLVLDESRPTIPSENGVLAFRAGIYNAFVSEADETFDNQILFVDEMKKY
ncbi:MAG: polysaccharide lyase [Phycisphaerales bacterium]|nr:polysaccharide lyase [Phycisphaerales bacterium]